ncbi:MAG: hypothetical protein C0594_02700, partial [Marinilabiliales bacterium]
THAPHEVPMEEVVHWPENKAERKYLNSGYYTDKCIGEMIEAAKKQDWYKNTLFIFMADHGHQSYRHWGYYAPNSRKIPFLFYGDVIKKEYRGKRVDPIISQLDLPKTLLYQLGCNTAKYTWSKNALNYYVPQYAGFAFEVGFGWVRSFGSVTYDYEYNRFFEGANEGMRDSLYTEGAMYMQRIYDHFLAF